MSRKRIDRPVSTPMKEKDKIHLIFACLLAQSSYLELLIGRTRLNPQIFECSFSLLIQTTNIALNRERNK